MLKAIETLTRNCTSMKVGNHRVEIDRLPNGNELLRKYFYHDHLICLVDMHNNVCMTNHCGWGTSSTSRAINDYIRYYVKWFSFLHVNADELGIEEREMMYKMREGNFK